jgi:hypothetical protein
MWNRFKLVWKNSYVYKNKIKNDAKVGERHALIVVSDTKSWKFPFRQGFLVKL